MALRSNDVDLEKGVLQVRHNLTWVSGIGYVEGEPKTKKGRRRIVLPGVVVDTLKEHKEMQEQARAKMDDRWQELSLVFCNTSGGFFNPSLVRLLFKDSCFFVVPHFYKSFSFVVPCIGFLGIKSDGLIKSCLC